MSQLPANIEKVSDIINALNGGIAFYKDTKEKVAGQNLQAIFSRMLEEKQLAVLALQSYAGDFKPIVVETQKDWTVEISNMYTQLLAHVNSANDNSYFAQLEDVEDEVLASIDIALEQDQPQEFACELRRIRSRMQQCREELHSLQQSSAIAG